MDDHFPVFSKEAGMMRTEGGAAAGEPGMPIYASANENELWTAVIEKAFAKAHKGYAITKGGFTGIALRELTGAPSRTYRFRERSGFSTESLWSAILDGEKR